MTFPRLADLIQNTQVSLPGPPAPTPSPQKSGAYSLVFPAQMHRLTRQAIFLIVMCIPVPLPQSETPRDLEACPLTERVITVSLNPGKHVGLTLLMF